MISVGVQFKGGDINITAETNLYHSFTAVTNIVFAYCEQPSCLAGAVKWIADFC